MKRTTAIVIVSLGLATSALAQTVVANITPDKMESRGVAFSVQMECSLTRHSLPSHHLRRRSSHPSGRLLCDLEDGAGASPHLTQIINGKPLLPG